MTSSTIVDRYASALVDVVTNVATSHNSKVSPADALAQLRAFDELAQQSRELRTALDSPAISLSRKRAVIGKFTQILGSSITIRNFLYVLSDKRRLSALHEIVEAFDLQLDARLGFVRAEVTAAQQMDQAEIESLTQHLAGVTGKQIRLKFQVDPSLIGGVVARVGSKVYDGSLRGRLDTLARHLSVSAS
jgi:F-type H+-transporting ATPase subunit delta